MPKISVIVPIYNAEKYIKKCIDSLVSEKGDYEFILINDGSTDKTEEIIKTYQDSRIKYYKNKNRGIGYTRNFGIEKSIGENLLFLDSDDYLEKGILKSIYQKQKTEQSDMIVYNYKVIDNDKESFVKIKEFKTDALVNNKELITNVNLSPWNKLYNRDLIIKNNIKFPENLKYEDAPFVIEALVKSKKIGYLDEFGYNYIVHSSSETTIRDDKVFDIFKILEKIKQILVKYPEQYKELLVKIITNYTIQQRYNKNHKDGLKFVEKAFDIMKADVQDYKNNKYYKNRNVLKRTIEKNKFLTIIYLKIYWLIK